MNSRIVFSKRDKKIQKRDIFQARITEFKGSFLVASAVSATAVVLRRHDDNVIRGSKISQLPSVK